jgi:hypothetical protein
MDLIQYKIPEFLCHWNTAPFSIQHTRTCVPLEHGCLFHITFHQPHSTGTRVLRQYKIPELVCHVNTASYSIQRFITRVPMEHGCLFNAFRDPCVIGTRRFTQNPHQDCRGTAARHLIQNLTTKLLFTLIPIIHHSKADRCVTPTQPFIQHHSAGPQPSIQHATPWLVLLLCEELWHSRATHTLLSLEARVNTCNIGACDTSHPTAHFLFEKHSVETEGKVSMLPAI